MRNLFLHLKGSNWHRYAVGKDFLLWLQKGQFSLAQCTENEVQKCTFPYKGPPNTYARAELYACYSLRASLRADEFLKHAGCSCQSVQLFSVGSGVRANNRLNLFCCYSCNLIASAFVKPVGICHKI